MNLRAVLCLVTTLALPVALCGCPVAIVGGLAAAGGAGYTANQERGVTVVLTTPGTVGAVDVRGGAPGAVAHHDCLDP